MTFDVGSNLAKAFADAHESETADGVDKTMDGYIELLTIHLPVQMAQVKDKM